MTCYTTVLSLDKECEPLCCMELMSCVPRDVPEGPAGGDRRWDRASGRRCALGGDGGGGDRVRRLGDAVSGHCGQHQERSVDVFLFSVVGWVYCEVYQLVLNGYRGGLACNTVCNYP